tara:strand:+ start:2403 stop:2693 length:291 start_codon:yes stop_codon:yes gene_type:complete
MTFDYNKISFKNSLIDKLNVPKRTDTTSTDPPKYKNYHNLPTISLKEEEFKTFVDTTSQENYDKIPFMFRLGDTTRPKSVRIKEFKERFNINKKKK